MSISLKGNSKRIIIGLSLFCVLCCFLSGCATVFGDNTRAIRVDSQPPGASVYIDNQQYGVTPAVISLPTYIYGGKNIQLRKEGYLDQSMMINTRFQPVALVNFLCWPGFIIDAATGDLVKIDPVNLNMNTQLQPVLSKGSE